MTDVQVVTLLGIVVIGFSLVIICDVLKGIRSRRGPKTYIEPGSVAGKVFEKAPAEEVSTEIEAANGSTVDEVSAPSEAADISEDEPRVLIGSAEEVKATKIRIEQALDEAAASNSNSDPDALLAENNVRYSEGRVELTAVDERERRRIRRELEVRQNLDFLDAAFAARQARAAAIAGM